jgi:hypothetical protein
MVGLSLPCARKRPLVTSPGGKLIDCEGPFWVGCGPTSLAAWPGLQSESNFRFRCYRTPDLAKLHGHIVEKRDVRLIKSVEDLSMEELEAIIAIPGVSDGTRH